nr:MAG TPA: hypothetical protein [Caudoviricetes sp.]
MGGDPGTGALRRQDPGERQAAVRRNQRVVRHEGLLLGEERILRPAVRLGSTYGHAAACQPARCGLSDGGDGAHQQRQRAAHFCRSLHRGCPQNCGDPSPQKCWGGVRKNDYPPTI